MPGHAHAHLVVGAADPGELGAVELHALGREHRIETGAAADDGEHRAVLRRDPIHPVGEPQAAGAFHVPRDDVRPSGDVLADVAGERAGVEIVAAADAVADIELDVPALVELGRGLRGGERQRPKHQERGRHRARPLQPIHAGIPQNAGCAEQDTNPPAGIVSSPLRAARRPAPARSAAACGYSATGRPGGSLSAKSAPAGTSNGSRHAECGGASPADAPRSLPAAAAGGGRRDGTDSRNPAGHRRPGGRRAAAALHLQPRSLHGLCIAARPRLDDGDGRSDPGDHLRRARGRGIGGDRARRLPDGEERRGRAGARAPPICRRCWAACSARC